MLRMISNSTSYPHFIRAGIGMLLVGLSPGLLGAQDTNTKRIIGEQNMDSFAFTPAERGGLGLRSAGWDSSLSKIANPTGATGQRGGAGGKGMDGLYFGGVNDVYLGESKYDTAREYEYTRIVNGKTIKFFQGSREWARYLVDLLRTHGNTSDKKAADIIESALEANRLHYLIVRTHSGRGSASGSYQVGKLQFGMTTVYQQSGSWRQNGDRYITGAYQRAKRGRAPTNAKAEGSRGYGLAFSAISLLGVVQNVSEPYMMAWNNHDGRRRITAELNEYLSTQPANARLDVRIIYEDLSERLGETIVGRVWVEELLPENIDHEYWINGPGHAAVTDVAVHGWPVKQLLEQEWQGTAKVERTGSSTRNTEELVQKLKPGFVSFTIDPEAPYPQLTMKFAGRTLSGRMYDALPEVIEEENGISLISSGKNEKPWHAKIWFEEVGGRNVRMKGWIDASEGNRRTFNLELADPK